jgi:transposase
LANIPAERTLRQSFAFSRILYRYLNLVERFSGKLKNARGVATRYDRRADNFLAARKRFSARIWIRSPVRIPRSRRTETCFEVGDRSAVC